MTKSIAAKKIAPKNSALTEIPNLPVVAAAQEEPDSFYMDLYCDTGNYLVSHYDAEPRKSRSCVPAMANDGNKPSCACEHCGIKTVEKVCWSGFLQDSTCARSMPHDQPFILATSEDGVRCNREGIILILENFARKIGCELTCPRFLLH
jgi:hypothetical protein